MKANRKILVVGPDEGRIYDEFLFPPKHPADLAGDGNNQEKSNRHLVYDVSRADNKTEAIELIKASISDHQPYSLIILAIKSLGDKDLTEFCGQVRQTDPLLKILIAGDSDKNFQEETGCDDEALSLKQPFAPGEIIRLAGMLTKEWNLEKKIAILEDELQTANKKMADMNRTLMKKVERQTAMIVQAEKMASVGLLAAGVAHEINNPISYVHSNLFTITKYFSRIKGLYDEYLNAESFLKSLGIERAEQLMEKIHAFKSENKIQMIMEDLEIIAEDSMDGINRVKTIVSNLKTFSRIDEEEVKPVDINQAINTALNIIWNEIKYKVEVEKDFQDLPQVKCFSQKISQVFMNLLINAAQAIEEKGKIFITTRMVSRGRREEDQFIQIRISDTGSGIPKEELGKIFDPFFTTKPVGQGTGLGLSIVYEIVKAHGGRIDVVSKLGKGTRFTLHLPATPQNLS